MYKLIIISFAAAIHCSSFSMSMEQALYNMHMYCCYYANSNAQLALENQRLTSENQQLKSDYWLLQCKKNALSNVASSTLKEDQISILEIKKTFNKIYNAIYSDNIQQTAYEIIDIIKKAIDEYHKIKLK